VGACVYACACQRLHVFMCIDMCTDGSVQGAHIHTRMCAWTLDCTYTAHTHTRISLHQNIFLVARPRVTTGHPRQKACHHAATQPASSCNNRLGTPLHVVGSDLVLTPRCATSGCLRQKARHHAATQPASSCHNRLGTPLHVVGSDLVLTPRCATFPHGLPHNLTFRKIAVSSKYNAIK